MTELIKHVELLPQGVLVVLVDGSEGLLDPKAIMACFHETEALERLRTLRATLRTETQWEPQDKES